MRKIMLILLVVLIALLPLAAAAGETALEKNEVTGYQLVVDDDAHIIITNGSTFRVKKGITVSPGCTLYIYGQSGNTGQLIANEEKVNKCAGIGGGNNESYGRIVINGATVTAYGGSDAAGIGSGNEPGDGNVNGTIIINGGTMYVTASDDGVNAAGGQDQSSQGGRPGQNNFNPGAPGGGASNASITVNGGYLFVVASGDGVDSNGSLSFNGGPTIVQGPSTGGNFAIDADGTVGFNGGTVMAVCSSNAMWEDINGKLGNAVYTKSAGSVQKNGVIAVTDASGNVLSAVKSQISGSVGVLYYNSSVSSLTSCKSVVGGNYSGSFDSFGYAEGGSISGGTSTALSQTSAGGGGGRPGGPGGRF